MTRIPSRTALGGLVAVTALSVLGLLAASPASSHTNNLYGYLEGEPNEEVEQTFVTIDRMNGAATPLPMPADLISDNMVGIEVFNETGTAIGVRTTGVSRIWRVISWDHSTGAEPDAFNASVSGAIVQDMRGLDTRLDGTLLTSVIYEIPEDGIYAQIASVDRSTGVLTPLIDISDLVFEDDYVLQSLATDPLTGVTYAFFRPDETNESYFAVVDLVAGELGPLQQFTGTDFEGGAIWGADFDADGTLYFVFANSEQERYELSTVGAPTTWATAPRNFAAVFGSNLEGFPLSPSSLTIEYTAPPPTPTLSATGSEVNSSWVIAGVLALLAGGLLVGFRVRARP